MTRLTVRGINVNIHIWNEQAKETIVMLHGFTGSLVTWRKVVLLLPKTIRIIGIDLIGHGKTDSPLEVEKYSMQEQMKLLEDIFSHLNLQSFTLLGYSMGGRVALSYASEYPNRLKQLILESSSPGLKTEEEQAARRIADEALANQIEQFGIEAFVNKWENIPLFASQKSLPIDVQQTIRDERLSQTPIGLANSLRGMGTGAQNSRWSELHHISIPVTLITGSLDEKFCKIALQMKNHLPNVHHIMVNDVGHAIHVENPEHFATIVEETLRNNN